MPLAYLPMMAERAGPAGPRQLVQSTRPAWCAAVPAVAAARVALVTSAAVRRATQPPFQPPDDLSYRLIPADPAVADLVIDHRSPVGTDARRDVEVVFPRAVPLWSVRPTCVLVAPELMFTPAPAFGRAAVPLAFSPIRLPWMTAPAALAPVTSMPSDPLPAIRLPNSPGPGNEAGFDPVELPTTAFGASTRTCAIMLIH